MWTLSSSSQHRSTQFYVHLLRVGSCLRPLQLAPGLKRAPELSVRPSVRPRSTAATDYQCGIPLRRSRRRQRPPPTAAANGRRMYAQYSITGDFSFRPSVRLSVRRPPREWIPKHSGKYSPHDSLLLLLPPASLHPAFGALASCYLPTSPLPLSVMLPLGDFCVVTRERALSRRRRRTWFLTPSLTVGLTDSLTHNAQRTHGGGGGCGLLSVVP